MGSGGEGLGDELAGLVGGLDRDVMAALLVRAGLVHDDVARSVRLVAASDIDRLRVLRTAVDQGLRTRRFLDYRESSGWAADGRAVVEALAVEGAERPSRELVVLIERAVGHVVKVILHAEDSGGQIGSLATDLLLIRLRWRGGWCASRLRIRTSSWSIRSATSTRSVTAGWVPTGRRWPNGQPRIRLSVGVRSRSGMPGSASRSSTATSRRSSRCWAKTSAVRTSSPGSPTRWSSSATPTPRWYGRDVASPRPAAGRSPSSTTLQRRSSRREATPTACSSCASTSTIGCRRRRRTGC